MHTDRRGHTCRQKCGAKGSGEVKIQELMHRDTTNVEPECMIIPVITGATGVVTRSLGKNLEAVPGKHSIDSLQKTATLGTAHTIRKALQCEA
jgi:hypothetical protein